MIQRCVFLLLLLCTMAVQVGGCQRGDVEISAVTRGQAAPHAGWNFGPGSYLEQGDEVKVTGVVLRIKGTDPNEAFR